MSRLRTLLSTTSLTLFAAALTPLLTSAHEVYVLSPDTIPGLEAAPRVPFFSILFANLSDTIIWGGIVAFLIVSVFLISISATLENRFDKYLVKLKHFAPFIARVTAGIAFMSCAYHGALFGPELPLEGMYGEFSGVIAGLLYVLGTLMVIGVYSRFAGLVGLMLFAVGLWYHGIYMSTYLNYFAEMIVLVLVGGHKLSVDKNKKNWLPISTIFDQLANRYGELAFLFLRIGFGVSLIYSSVYAKIIHNQLAIAVVEQFNLVGVFGFNAEFIVFGAAIIEILLGLFIILGIEIRFNAIVLNVFLTLSLVYFGESVWPHIILIGIPIALFCYGYDKYSLEGYFFKKGNREPIF